MRKDEGEEDEGHGRRTERHKSPRDPALEGHGHEDRHGKQGEKPAQIEQRGHETGQDRMLAQLNDESSEHA